MLVQKDSLNKKTNKALNNKVNKNPNNKANSLNNLLE